MDLFDQISNDIKEAMKAKDKVKLETLRNVKKFFLEAKTAPGANDTLTDDAALKIMQKLVKQGKDSAAVYEGQGRADLAEAEMAQDTVSEDKSSDIAKAPESNILFSFQEPLYGVWKKICLFPQYVRITVLS